MVFVILSLILGLTGFDFSSVTKAFEPEREADFWTKTPLMSMIFGIGYPWYPMLYHTIFYEKLSLSINLKFSISHDILKARFI